MSVPEAPLTLDKVISWAHSGRESDKVYRFIFLHPEDLLTIPHRRSWPIAHQIVFHGDVNLLKRILALYLDDQINIRTLSKDRKTLLDVAKERKMVYPAMYNYVEHLFLQDDLIQAAKDSSWRLVMDILKQNPELANEKPPYSTNFLLHYVIENGDKELLEQLLRTYRFQMNVLSANNETLADMAKRLRRTDLYSILEPETNEQSHSDLIRCSARSTILENRNLSNKNPLASTVSLPTVLPLSPSSVQLPYPTVDPFTFGNLEVFLNITDGGDFTTATENKLTTINPQSSAAEEQKHTTKVSDNSIEQIEKKIEHNSDVIVTPSALPAQIMKNLTCSLTQEIFIDPVIASDGQTYERAAITEWVKLYHCSPMTGAAMKAIFKDNTEIKQIAQSMKSKSETDIMQ